MRINNSRPLNIHKDAALLGKVAAHNPLLKKAIELHTGNKTSPLVEPVSKGAADTFSTSYAIRLQALREGDL